MDTSQKKDQEKMDRRYSQRLYRNGHKPICTLNISSIMSAANKNNVYHTDIRNKHHSGIEMLPAMEATGGTGFKSCQVHNFLLI